MRNLLPHNQRGYSLIELVIVVVVLGVIAGIAVRSLRSSNEVTRTNTTLARMDRLAYAVAGNPNRLSGGVRIDYGYVGDIGATPPALDALVYNPGGFATWNGPYIRDQFSSSGADYSFRHDAWGRPFVYVDGASIVSNSPSGQLTRQIAGSVDDLLHNRVTLTVTDIQRVPPGPTFADSIRLVLIYPDGAGSFDQSVRQTDAGGHVTFDSIPIGLHRLHIIYVPDADTITRMINVDPGRTYYSEITLARSLW